MSKRRFNIGYKNYKQKPLSNSLIRDIKKMQRYLQEEENKKNGRKSQEVTFVFASKELSRLIGNVIKRGL